MNFGIFTCRDNGKSLSSRASATVTCSFSNGIFAFSWEGAHTAEMASMKRIKLSCCLSPSMSLTQYFSIPFAATLEQEEKEKVLQWNLDITMCQGTDKLDRYIGRS